MEISTIILGACGGALSNFLLRIWQYRRDYWFSRVDYFCKTLEVASELAINYWCKEVSKNGNLQNREEDKKNEIKILAIQMLLDGMLETFISKFNIENQESIMKSMANLNSAMTGGDFQTSSLRTADYNRARDVSSCCSNILILVRKASDEVILSFSVIENIKKRMAEVKKIKSD